MSNLGLICDLDGTLVDSVAGIQQAVDAVCSEYGVERIPLETIRAHVGEGLENLLDRCLPDLVAQIGVAPLVEQYRDYYGSLKLLGSPYPGVVDTLTKLQEGGWILGVATNRSSEFAELVLKTFLPEISFRYVGGVDRVSERKPSPSHLLEVMKKLELEPGQSWYIGDHAVDAQCAEAAGVKFLGVSYGYGAPAAGTVIDAFPDVLKHIEQ